MSEQNSVGAERAAVLLLSLGADAASEVMRHLGEQEVRAVSQALAQIDVLEQGHVEDMHKELEQSLAGTGALPVDGRGFALTVVDRALGAEDDEGAGLRDDILSEIRQSGGGDKELAGLLVDVPPQGLAQILDTEHPQVVTLVLAHAPASVAGETLELLSEALQADVVERLARLESVPAQLSAEVGSVLKEQLKGVTRPSSASLGGPRAVAELMNHTDKDLEARLLEEMEKGDPDLADRVRKLMFTFDDCVGLDNRSLQTLLKEVAREDLLLSLKTACSELAEKIYANISSRAAEILREDLASSGPVRLKDVEEAQARVIGTLRELEADGKVVIAGGGKDDVLV